MDQRIVDLYDDFTHGRVGRRAFMSRLAASGFLAVAPDALSPDGGAPADEDEARQEIRALDLERTTGDFVAAVAFAAEHPRSTGMVGCVGFRWGGAMANQLAVRCTDLKVAVAFYGRQPTVEDAARIECTVQLHYAGLDQRINTGIEDYENALKAAEVEYELYLYDGVNHAFHNDTSSTRYDATAADLAWERTLGVLSRSLTTPEDTVPPRGDRP